MKMAACTLGLLAKSLGTLVEHIDSSLIHPVMFFTIQHANSLTVSLGSFMMIQSLRLFATSSLGRRFRFSRLSGLWGKIIWTQTMVR